MSLKFVAWFKNLGRVNATDANNQPKIPRPSLIENISYSAPEIERIKEVARLKREVSFANKKAEFFKDALVAISKKRKEVTPDDFEAQMDALLDAQEALVYHRTIAHQNPLTTNLLSQNRREAMAQMWFITFESPSMTPEDAEALYQKYLVETTEAEIDQAKEQQ